MSITKYWFTPRCTGGFDGAAVVSEVVNLSTTIIVFAENSPPTTLILQILTIMHQGVCIYLFRNYIIALR